MKITFEKIKIYEDGGEHDEKLKGQKIAVLLFQGISNKGRIYNHRTVLLKDEIEKFETDKEMMDFAFKISKKKIIERLNNLDKDSNKSNLLYEGDGALKETV